MSTEKLPPSIPAYSDAEKGILDTIPPSSYYPADKKEVVKQPAPPKPSPKPKKRVSKWILWKIWFNTYRKFFTFVFTLNMVGIGLAISGHFPYAVNNSGAMVVGNLNFAILMRNEVFGRLLYLFVNTLFAKWTPLWFRLGCTSVLQHLGGIHSGCALSGVLWLLFKVVNSFRHLDVTHDAILIMGVVTNVAVIISALSAFPWVRNTHHNVFERQHRFIGWLGLICTWIFVILGDTYNPETRSWDTAGQKLIRHQDFWYTCSMTFFIVLPWICVREVPVDIELPSPKVAIIRFKRGMQQGLLGRISRSSIMEYHAFGIISEGTHAKYHYMIAGVQGDFTKGLVNDPPKTLWTRELKFAGVSNTSTLYRRGIRICTGTGIGAALSTCLQSPYWYLIWIGSDQEKTFGPTIAGLINRHLEGRVTLWDSKQRGGRPDTMKLLSEVYHSWDAEVVFITSNFIGNSEMMEGCKAAGIPAFGTLWDF
ncbi:Urb2 domain-containing protein [Mycena indigotica]|uniref:Urb2 domain-containing protein n=1 Tax=Mycena indigotica TaxID=2126181 RepID=A0A8H6VYP2_9AGAR|nr:Urb2 domain-containing protein [Mycena indigotica]KAF7295113.1 Urb2 domain-containing protein [Mycena indigotica]